MVLDSFVADSGEANEMNWQLIGIFLAGFVCGWLGYLFKFMWGFKKALKTSPVCPTCCGKWGELQKDAKLWLSS
jgi:hypothetical protein